MPNLSQHVTDRLISWRWPLLAVGIVLAMVSWPAATDLSFDRSIENMFAADDPMLPPFRRVKRTFGGDEIVLVVYADDGLLAPDHSGIRRLAEVADRLQRVPGVAAVLSLDRLLVEDVDVEQPEERDYFAIDSRLGQSAIELFEGYTHGADRRTAAVVCMLVPQAKASALRRETIDQLKREIETLRAEENGSEQAQQRRAVLKEVYFAGEPVMVTDGFRYVEEDGQRLGWVSTILLAVTIIICFRSLRWVVIPIAVVQLTLLLTKAVLVWSGLRLSMVSSMLTAIVTVVGIATVMHVIVRFRDARQAGLAPRDALSRAGGLIAAAIVWACATDAAGFAALGTAHVGPVQDFGAMMAIGSLLVIVSVALLLPGLALLGRIPDDPRRAWGESLMDAQLSWLVSHAERRPLLVAVILLAAGAGIATGTSRLKVESDFTRNFREGSSIVESYAYVEQHLGGAGVWDVVVPAPENLDWPYLRRILQLESRLRSEIVLAGANEPADQAKPGLTKVISLADALVAGSPVDLESVRLTFIRNGMVRSGLAKMRQRMPAFADALHGEDPAEPGNFYMRIMLRSWERQPAEQKQRLIAEVRAIVEQEFPPTESSPGGEVTGFFVLLARLIESMLRDQWLTFGWATIGITIMMLLALRDPRLAVIALVPNALPILVVMGAMGWIGLKINMGAAMIAAVSLGLSIDSSIHYLTSFQRARLSGRTVHEALSEVQQTVGRAMVFSTLALIVGFAVLMTSNFVPTVYFGALVSLAMVGGLAGNLVILPVLLTLFVRDRTAR